MMNENNNIRIEDDPKQYVYQLLKEGDTIPVDGDDNTYEIHLPPWYNEKLIKRAQKYYRTNFWSAFYGKFCGLIAILAIPSILKILIHTKQSGTPKAAYRRYLQTILHTLNWYEDELKPGTKAWKSLEGVRKRHVRMSRFCQSKAGIITQKDMALTQFGFIGYILLKHDYVGVTRNHEDIEAFVHFWRVIGYMLGIEDRFNICTDSYATTVKRLEAILNNCLKPALENTGNEFYEMTDALVSGMWSFNPLLDTDAFIFHVKNMSGCEGYRYYKSEMSSDKEMEASKAILDSYGWYTKFIIWFVATVQQTAVKYTVFRWYFNGQMIVSRFLITYFPFLAFHRYGFRDSYVRIFKEE